MLTIKVFTFSPIEENTYLLYNEDGEACLIDPGCYDAHEEDGLAAFIVQKGLTVKLLLNTHCHLDHVFGLRWAAEKYKLVPHLHASEEQMLKLAPVSGQMWNMPFKNYEGPLQFLTDGQQILLGEEVLWVLFTPGHSPGHVCFYCPRQGFVIGGDVLFKQSIGRTDLPFGNASQLIDSIKSKLFPLPDDTVVYSGHGPATTIGHEKKYNPFVGI